MKTKTIPSADLAALAGVTERRLAQIAEAGAIPKAVRGQYPADETLTALFAYFRKRGDTEANSLRASKARESTARAEALERENKLAEGSVIKADVAKQILAARLNPIRSALLSWPSALSSRCNPADPEIARTVIEEAVEKLLTDASK